MGPSPRKLAQTGKIFLESFPQDSKMNQRKILPRRQKSSLTGALWENATPLKVSKGVWAIVGFTYENKRNDSNA